MAAKNCRTCAYSGMTLATAGVQADGQQGELTCRLHPPTVQVVGGLTPQGIAAQVITAWPSVKGHDYCGQHYSDTLNAH